MPITRERRSARIPPHAWRRRPRTTFPNGPNVNPFPSPPAPAASTDHVYNNGPTPTPPATTTHGTNNPRTWSCRSLARTTLWGMKHIILLLFTLAYVSCYCNFLSKDADVESCSRKLLMMELLSYYMHWATFKAGAVLILYDFITSVKFNYLNVAVVSSLLAILLVIILVACWVLQIIKHVFRPVRSI